MSTGGGVSQVWIEFEPILRISVQLCLVYAGQMLGIFSLLSFMMMYLFIFIKANV